MNKDEPEARKNSWESFREELNGCSAVILGCSAVLLLACGAILGIAWLLENVSPGAALPVGLTVMVVAFLVIALCRAISD